MQKQVNRRAAGGLSAGPAPHPADPLSRHRLRVVATPGPRRVARTPRLSRPGRVSQPGAFAPDTHLAGSSSPLDPAAPRPGTSPFVRLAGTSDRLVSPAHVSPTLEPPVQVSVRDHSDLRTASSRSTRRTPASLPAPPKSPLDRTAAPPPGGSDRTARLASA